MNPKMRRNLAPSCDRIISYARAVSTAASGMIEGLDPSYKTTPIGLRAQLNLLSWNNLMLSVQS
jgi:hypothetical protein